MSRQSTFNLDFSFLYGTYRVNTAQLILFFFVYSISYGDYTQVIARYDLIRVLLSRIPPHKILYNKRVLSTKHEDDEVIIHCHDNTAYAGTILIGADGAYSSVRQNMYKEMSAMGLLPKVDAKPLGYDYDCLVGVTKPLDPKKYPVLNDEFCEFQIVLGKEIPYSVSWTINWQKVILLLSDY